ncbi:hypothetical protein SAMN06265365_104138 [Tistlia consotensis]|uniref:Uncharacterized protein n=1 Tax=Tistlia consotensis USBA 355 TaxID=560819 RepID=A0A1Y6BVC9_9PROT|nr:hypothetical protein SAMN05428998_107156 [Tistlia consotensis USBA 355]SNR46306.1 hypothetical protein SAMN06265365_104138 [Tistlia consotensis]
MITRREFPSNNHRDLMLRNMILIVDNFVYARRFDFIARLKL